MSRESGSLVWMHIGSPAMQAFLASTGALITLLALVMVAAGIFLILPLRRRY
jgi:hypothetical protein